MISFSVAPAPVVTGVFGRSPVLSFEGNCKDSESQHRNSNKGYMTRDDIMYMGVFVAANHPYKDGYLCKTHMHWI